MTASRKRRSLILILLFLITFAVIIFNSIPLVKLIYPLPYSEHIISAAAENGLDPLLITAIIKTESSFDPLAVSPKGARGLMQIMPETGQWIARHLEMEPFQPDLLFDPKINIRMGSWYLASLQTEFDNNMIAVLAAYNGGNGNVKKWIKDGTLSINANDVNKIPFPETEHFVRKVSRDYHIYQWLYHKDMPQQMQ